MARQLIAREDLLHAINVHLESLPDCRNLHIPEVVPDPSRKYGGNWTTNGLDRSGSDHDQDACGCAIWDFMRNLQDTYDIHLDANERALFHESGSGDTEEKMSDDAISGDDISGDAMSDDTMSEDTMSEDTSNTRVTRYGKYIIESHGIEVDGRWVPEYRILKDGQTAMNWRKAHVSALPSANAAIDVGIDLAIDDINTKVFESDV